MSQLMALRVQVTLQPSVTIKDISRAANLTAKCDTINGTA